MREPFANTQGVVFRDDFALDPSKPYGVRVFVGVHRTAIGHGLHFARSPTRREVREKASGLLNGVSSGSWCVWFTHGPRPYVCTVDEWHGRESHT